MKISERRRDEIAQTAIRLISLHGLDALSFRAISAEMECSTGVLTHHFRDKAALIDFVIDTIIADLGKVARERSGPRAGMATFLLHLLPHDEETRMRWHALVAFTTASLSEPGLQEANARREAMLREPMIALLTRQPPTSAGSSPTDADQADLVLAFLDGLALRILLEPGRFPRRRVKDLVQRFLAGLRSQD